MQAGDWYYQCVTELASAGVINGCPDGTFKPTGTASAGEALKLILLACGYPLANSSQGHWAQSYRDFAVEKGFLDPGAALDAPITRETVAKLTALAKGLAPAEGEKPFTDTDSPYAAALYQAGVMQGDGSGRFAPANTITRAEVAMIVWRLNQGKQA